MTQVPWLDKLLHKNAVMASFRKASGNVIFQIAADNVARRKAEANDAPRATEGAKTDFLAEFLKIQAENPSIPQW
jgi:hypothetical protein